MLFFGGANDILAEKFDLSLNTITYAVRIGVFLVPFLTYVVTKRIALGLQRRDRDKLLHGRETGKIRRLPHGEFVEVHERLDRGQEYALLARARYAPLPAPEPEHDGVPTRRAARKRCATGSAAGSTASRSRCRPRRRCRRRWRTSATPPTVIPRPTGTRRSADRVPQKNGSRAGTALIRRHGTEKNRAG
ncbi:hypothetical protein Sxan_22410 [Streptomyces xanthophaeus]|uniref:Uncharacterized protein n=1 Tax=Streptomyces xanthophaeus TaxID=67385 RepID=A0A919GX12_9ACTN|nr:hypothetical protein Sxan_22410 [Streptomyces xanthophaeus]